MQDTVVKQIPFTGDYQVKDNVYENGHGRSRTARKGCQQKPLMMLPPASGVSQATVKLSTAPFFHKTSGCKRKHPSEEARVVRWWMAPSLATSLYDGSAWGLGCESRRCSSELVQGNTWWGF